VEYAPLEAKPLERHRCAEHLDRFKALVGEWFDERGRTGFSDVVTDESSREVQLRVTRGMIPRTQPIVVDQERVERIDFIPARPDLLIFDKRTSVLSINAQLAVEHDGYRRMFGRVFFDSPDHFAVNELYTGDPLLIDAAAALSSEGFPQIQDVALREVRFAAPPKIDRARFVAARLNDSIGGVIETMATLTGGALSVCYVKLAFHLTSRKRPTVAEIRMTNRCKVDRRFAGEIVRQFLLARGFLRLPELPAPVVAEAAA
jgi:hypothetical protein